MLFPLGRTSLIFLTITKQELSSDQRWRSKHRGTARAIISGWKVWPEDGGQGSDEWIWSIVLAKSKSFSVTPPSLCVESEMPTTL
jgi:hypothetical protein